MNNFWRRRVEDHAVREIAVFGDDRQAVRQRVVPYLRIRPFVTEVILMNVIVAFPQRKVTCLEDGDKDKESILDKLNNALEYAKNSEECKVAFSHKGIISNKKLTSSNMFIDKDGNSIDFSASIQKKQWFNIPKR